MDKLVVALLGMEFTTCSQPIKGVRVEEVKPGLAAHREGLRVGDLIQACHDAPLFTREDLVRAFLGWLVSTKLHASLSAVFLTLKLSILRSGMLIQKELSFRKNPDRKFDERASSLSPRQSFRLDAIAKSEEDEDNSARRRSRQQQMLEQKSFSMPSSSSRLSSSLSSSLYPSLSHSSLLPPPASRAPSLCSSASSQYFLSVLDPEPFLISRFLSTRDEPPQIDIYEERLSTSSSSASPVIPSVAHSSSLISSASSLSLAPSPSVLISESDPELDVAWTEFRNGLGLETAMGHIRGIEVTRASSTLPEGLVNGDLIQALNGIPTANLEELAREWCRAIRSASPGVSAHAIFTVLRSNRFLVFKMVPLPNLTGEELEPP